MSGQKTFTFLNETGAVHRAEDWANAARTMLWLYNLHYFDDLSARDAKIRRHWHRTLIDHWIDDNAPGVAPGWEPYPTSLRLVNWVKWVLAGNDADARMANSIAIQSRWLEQRLESHLLGNHLIANAKALVFSGLFFDGPEAKRRYEHGMKLLLREFAEQVLPDGGHFERSPMYHHIILEDLLDLINIHQAFAISSPLAWTELATRMLKWAEVMSHPDDGIAFFNDAALSIAPSLENLRQYAVRLNLSIPQRSTATAIHLRDSGYVRLSSKNAVLLADLAPVGPDYLPAHAHADTLSFELSLHRQRVVVNGGTSVYGTGPERQRQRSTPAHSTLTLDDINSSEVWGGFRVGRRARVFGARVQDIPGQPSAEAGHDGYTHLPGSPRHHRFWRLAPDELLIRDRVEGGGNHQCELIFPLRPGLTARRANGQTVEVTESASSQQVATFEFTHNEVAIKNGTWHPQFGQAIPNQYISVKIRASLPLKHETRIRWRPL